MQRQKIYSDRIVELQKKNIIKPDQILFELFTQYLEENKSSPKLFGDGPDSSETQFIRNLVKLREYPSQESYVEIVIRHLKSAEHKKLVLNSDFYALLNAFFSEYEYGDKWNHLIGQWIDKIINGLNSEKDPEKNQKIFKQLSIVKNWVPKNKRKVVAEAYLNEYITHDLSPSKIIAIKQWIPQEMRKDFINAFLTKASQRADSISSQRAYEALYELSDWIPEETKALIVDSAKTSGAFTDTEHWLKADTIQEWLRTLTPEKSPPTPEEVNQNNAYLIQGLAIESRRWDAFRDIIKPRIKSTLPIEVRPVIIKALLDAINYDKDYNANVLVETLTSLKEWVPLEDREAILDRLLENTTQKFATRQKSLLALYALNDWIPLSKFEKCADKMIESIKIILLDPPTYTSIENLCLVLKSLKGMIPDEKKERLIAELLALYKCADPVKDALTLLKDELPLDKRTTTINDALSRFKGLIDTVEDGKVKKLNDDELFVSFWTDLFDFDLNWIPGPLLCQAVARLHTIYLSLLKSEDEIKLPMASIIAILFCTLKEHLDKLQLLQCSIANAKAQYNIELAKSITFVLDQLKKYVPESRIKEFTTLIRKQSNLENGFGLKLLQLHRCLSWEEQLEVLDSLIPGTTSLENDFSLCIHSYIKELDLNHKSSLLNHLQEKLTGDDKTDRKIKKLIVDTYRFYTDEAGEKLLKEASIQLHAMPPKEILTKISRYTRA